MKAIPSVLAALPALIGVLGGVSCTATYRVEGARGALAKRETARVVVNSEDSGDTECRRAVERELRSRGFRVAENGKAGIQVRMADTWYWDIVMYLRELDLVFSETGTGDLKAQAHYRNSTLHGFPDQTRVVERLFHELDARGVFTLPVHGRR